MSGQQTRERSGTGPAATGIVVRVVLAWADCYTGWVDAEAAERRREELHSDLWEQQADARATGRASFVASTSIARRAAVGIPADLLWVHTQRTAARSRPADRKASPMNTATRLAVQWWWALGAAVLAVWGIVGATQQLLQPGMPYLSGTLSAYFFSLALIVAIALRMRFPRTSAVLGVAGSVLFAMLFWAPVIMVVGILVVVGAAIDVVRLTAPRERVLAIIGLVLLGVSFVGYGASGLDAGPVGLVWFVLAPVGAAILIATGRRRVGTAPASRARPA